MYKCKYGFSSIQEVDEYLEKERQRILANFKKEWGVRRVQFSNGDINQFLSTKRRTGIIAHDPWREACHDDHVSFWKNKVGEKIAVSQPYSLNTAMIASIAERCRVCGLSADISGGGWHYPGATALVMYRKI